MLGDDEGSRTSLDKAAALVEPDWPAEFQIVVLRAQAYRRRVAEGPAAALPLYREAVRLAQEAGDWRLEFIQQVNFCDALWQLGAHDESAAGLGRLLAQRQRGPVSDYELVDAMTMRTWILCECGSVDEAVESAREALPLMRRMPKFVLEACAYLLWRLDRHEAAARTLGAHAALKRSGYELQGINEARLGRVARAALEVALPAAELATQMTLGEALGYPGVCALLAEALEQRAVIQ